MAAMFSSLVKNIGIDIGTKTSCVYVEGRGVVLSEPSVVATDTKKESIIAVGNEAEILLYKSPELVEALTPLKDGVIKEYQVTKTMIQQFVKKSVGKHIGRTRIIVSVPFGITDVEKRAMLDSLLQLGVREAYLVEAPVVAALCVNLPIFEPVGSLVVDIGAGTTDVAVMAMGGVVHGKSSRIGGNNMNYIIAKYIREHFNVMVSAEVVEEIKVSLGMALPPNEEMEINFLGRDLSNGLTRQITIRASEVCMIIEEVIVKIIEVIRSVVEQIPPELCSDIMESGMLLTGGVALMPGLKERISRELSIPVIVPENPESAVVRGLGVALRERFRMDRFFVSSQNRKG